ncbi:MAG: transglycosylase domain-containing protein [Actinobacteria bacterium]|nr:transglycosylase domain-containing protein [Actinomycetota bacterium]
MAVRRIVLFLGALLAACIASFVVLLLVTPSVGNAGQLAQEIDQAHAAPYPGVTPPARFVTALEATEDHRFASEPGIDPLALGRIVYSAVRGRGDQGGSTLYQQLAKMLYTPGDGSLRAKAEQVGLAVKLKYTYSGPEILRFYSDVAYFGHNFYGLQNASCGYFGVQPGQMSWPQAALLAGLVQAPSVDDPISNPTAGQAREQHVLDRLVSVGAISQASADSYKSEPLSNLLGHGGGCGSGGGNS